jgi:hypothetical protein
VCWGWYSPGVGWQVIERGSGLWLRLIGAYFLGLLYYIIMDNVWVVNAVRRFGLQSWDFRKNPCSVCGFMCGFCGFLCGFYMILLSSKERWDRLWDSGLRVNCTCHTPSCCNCRGNRTIGTGDIYIYIFINIFKMDFRKKRENVKTCINLESLEILLSCCPAVLSMT